MSMQVRKVYNNNVILAEADGREAVVIGRGIGFQKHAGDGVETDKVSKIYTPTSPDWIQNFMALMQDIDPAYFEVAAEILSNASTTLETQFSQYLLISLTDHIHFAVYRHQHHIDIKNEILWEIKRIYKKEYQLGQQALDLIDQRFHVRLPDDEAGFIGLKFVENSVKDLNGDHTKFMTSLISGVLDIVQYQLRMTLDEDSMSYQRFLVHLRFFAARVTEKKQPEPTEDDDVLYQHVASKYPAAFTCVQKVSTFIQSKTDRPVSLNEQVYLTMHVQRIIDEVSHQA